MKDRLSLQKQKDDDFLIPWFFSSFFSKEETKMNQQLFLYVLLLSVICCIQGTKSVNINNANQLIYLFEKKEQSLKI